MSRELELQNILSWAKENGAKISDNLEFKYSDEKGVHAFVKENISTDKKSHLIEIPQSILFTPKYSESIFDYLQGSDAAGKNPNAKSQLLLAKLKFDSNDTLFENINLTQKFKPYLDFLPNNGQETNCPYFWSMPEKELLDGTDAHIFMKRQFLKSLEEWKVFATQLYQLNPNEYPQLKDELLEYEAFKMGPVGGVAVNYLLNIKKITWTSFTAYLWASCIFTSRAFPYMLFDKNIKDLNTAFLIPVVDLLNHENERKVRWTVENNNFVFNTLDSDENIKAGMELFNNYGEKSNLDLLLGYGFVVNNNRYESATLTLQVDESVIDGAKSFGVKLPQDASVLGINFEITKSDTTPKSLIDFFSYLVKLTSEKKGITLRMRLEGISQIRSIIQTKINSLKSVEVKAHDNVKKERAEIIKKYRNTQKNIFQQSVEDLEKLEKKLLTKYKPFSFKAILKKDTKFSNALLLFFGTPTYDALVEHNYLDHAILLWIMRIANQEHYAVEDQQLFPRFILDTFKDVKTSLKIENADVTEYLPLYEALFPKLCQNIPEIFGKGEWTLNNLIAAATVNDRLGYKRTVNSEAFFIERLILKD